MTVIDADTHLREGYFLDKVYNLKGEFASFTPRRTRDGAYHEVHFEHDLEPPDREGGRIARIQPGGYDKDKRIADLESAGAKKQILFCTNSAIPTLNEGPLGLALAQSYNDWVVDFVKGYEDKLIPVGVLSAG